MSYQNPHQDFKPLSYLPMVSATSEQQLGELRKLRSALTRGGATPYLFDDATIDRVIRVHTETLQFVPHTRRQLDRWELDRPSASQRETIGRVRRETDETEQLVRDALATAQEIRSGTVDRVMAMADVELGLSALADTLPESNGKPGSANGESPRDEPEYLATQIDARITELTAADDRAIFDAMTDHMPALLRVLQHERLDDLCRRHPGLDRYLNIVEGRIAAVLLGAV